MQRSEIRGGRIVKTCSVINGEKQDTVINNVNDLTTSSVTGQFPATMEIPSEDVTILVVDDDRNIRNLLHELIEHAGYNCKE